VVTVADVEDDGLAGTQGRRLVTAGVET